MLTGVFCLTGFDAAVYGARGLGFGGDSFGRGPGVLSWIMMLFLYVVPGTWRIRAGAGRLAAGRFGGGGGGGDSGAGALTTFGSTIVNNGSFHMGRHIRLPIKELEPKLMLNSLSADIGGVRYC